MICVPYSLCADEGIVEEGAQKGCGVFSFVPSLFLVPCRVTRALSWVLSCFIFHLLDIASSGSSSVSWALPMNHLFHMAASMTRRCYVRDSCLTRSSLWSPLWSTYARTYCISYCTQQRLRARSGWHPLLVFLLIQRHAKEQSTLIDILHCTDLLIC